MYFEGGVWSNQGLGFTNPMYSLDPNIFFPGGVEIGMSKRCPYSTESRFTCKDHPGIVRLVSKWYMIIKTLILIKVCLLLHISRLTFQDVLNMLIATSWCVSPV